MLRGRGSCTISERPTPSSPLKTPLSLIIPVHPRFPPVSPIIPVHTQKQGGGGAFLNVQLSTLNCLSPLTPIIPALMQNRGVGAPTNASTDNAPVHITHCLLATKIQNVGAPTFLHPHAFAPVRAAYVDAGLQPRLNGLAFVNLKLTTDKLKLLQSRQVGMTEVMRLQVLSMDPKSSSDPGNILRAACVSMARGAQVCLLRRGRSERGALC